MKAIEWIGRARELPGKLVYAIHGDDHFLRWESLRAIVDRQVDAEARELSVTHHEGRSSSLADVLDDLRTLPFFSSRRVVVVDEADPLVTKYRKDLEAYVQSPSRAGTLVLLVKTWPASTNLAKLVESLGLSIDASSPSEKELVPWLVGLARAEYQAEIDTDAARLLVELVGGEAGILVAELSKLAVFVGEPARIKRTHVARMVHAGRVETVWKVIDAATTGAAAQAVKHLDELMASGEHPIGILAAFTSPLLKVHHAGRLRAARLGLDEACRQLGIYQVEKTGRQHAHLGPARVDGLPEMLRKADLDLKGGTLMDPRVVLEELLVRLASPRPD